jgi:hypothetical protein
MELEEQFQAVKAKPYSCYLRPLKASLKLYFFRSLKF